MLYVAVLCSAGLVLPGLRGYTAAGRSVFLFCTGLSLCYLAALVLAAAEVALTGGAGLRELLRPLTRLGGSRVCFLLYAVWAALSAACSEYEDVWLGLGLLQYAGMNPLGLFPERVDFHDAFVLYNGRFLGTLGNVDVLGGFLCLTVPLFYGAYLISGRRSALAPLAAVGCHGGDGGAGRGASLPAAHFLRYPGPGPSDAPRHCGPVLRIRPGADLGRGGASHRTGTAAGRRSGHPGGAHGLYLHPLFPRDGGHDRGGSGRGSQ